MRADSTSITLMLGIVVLATGLVWLTRLNAGAQDGAATTSSGNARPLAGSPATDAEPQSTGWRELTAEEERVIVHKGTERPFTGKYNDHFAEGIYACRRCGAMLYRSDDKFRAHSGWPAFDDEIPGAVKRLPDADGVRTEIACANCEAHLGHVFLGDGLTPKDTRHCVNSVSLEFIPPEQVRYGRAIFAAGCFWGVEHWFHRQPGVLDTTVGYTGGHTDNPTYESMHQNETGHAEAVEVLYDPTRVSYDELAKLFFEIHDPTQRNRQGPDIGAEYRSAIFYVNQDQKMVAERLIEDLQARGMHIATQVVGVSRFWPGEDYHQDWYLKKGSASACHSRKPLW